MNRLILCGVLRVAFTTFYVAAVFLRHDVARDLMVPFALVVWLIALYDFRDRRRRGRSSR